MTEIQKSNIKTAMSLKVQYTIGASGELSEEQKKFISQTLSNLNISIRTQGYGIPGLTGPTTREEFNQIVERAKDAPSAVLEKFFRPYSYASNFWGKDTDTSEFIKMADKWEKHLSYLDYIVSNPKITSSLQSSCMNAMTRITDQLSLIYSLNINARYPSDSDIASFKTLYNNYISEMKIDPARWFSMPVINIPRLFEGEWSTNLDFTSLNAVEQLKITAILNPYSSFVSSLICSPNLYLNKDGNLSLFKSYPSINMRENAIPQNLILYEGTKFHDIFTFKLERCNGILRIDSSTISCSYQEKISDIIWLYLKSEEVNAHR